MKMKFLRVGLAGLLCLATAPIAVSQPTRVPIERHDERPGFTAQLGTYVDCHATFFRSGTGTSYTAPSWKVAVAGLSDADKMAACKNAATQKWLANGKILWHLGYSTSEQDQICRSGKVEVRVSYGWQDPAIRARQQQPTFTYMVASPQCSCTCSKPTDTFIAAEKKCATRTASTPGINDGNLGGGYYGISGGLYQLNSSPYSCAFNMVTQSR